MKKYFKARGLKENYDPQNKHKDIFYFAEDTGQLLLDGVSYSEATDLTPYAKAINLPDSVISNADISSDENSVTLKYTKDSLIDGSNSEVNLQIPAATTSTAGVMSVADKQTVDSLPKYIIGSANSEGPYDIFKGSRNKSIITLKYNCKKIGSSDEIPSAFTFYPAEQDVAGIMSAQDKVKLDSLKNYQAGNGINITGDTISCTLDTSLYSIVTELPETGLPNKIYLLPSTETEEGNIYTEYGYVDNKWEEIGKYKADVDLSPYSKALRLPEYVLGGVDWSNAYILYYPNGIDIVFKYLNLINNSKIDTNLNISPATTKKSGVMSSSDKRKLDGIETGAQVNKIESVSVNGTPLEITNKDVDIPIHEYTAGDGIKLENGKFSLNPADYAADGYAWGGNVGYYFPIYNDGKLYNNISIYNVAHLRDEFGKLGLLSTSDYNAFKDKQDALTEVQLNNINNAITSISVNDVEQINTNGTVNLTIPNATPSKAGLMSASDKTKLNSPINYYYRNAGVDTKLTDSSTDNTCYIGSPVLEILGNKVEFKGVKLCTSNGTPYIDCSTSKAVASLLDGLMSKEDKAKLDSQPTIKASNATGVTDDDYVVIKKSEYQSILDRLSALEGS